MTKLNTIMLVEDDDSIRIICARALEKLGGFTVDQCSSGVELLERVVDASPQLIIMDVMMPELSGIETLSLLREINGAENIPVILSTARVQASQVEEYKKLDIIGVISKPFDPQKLSAAILDMWDKKPNRTLSSPASLDDKEYSDLRQQYAQIFPKKRDEIVSQWHHMHAGDINLADWRGFYFAVHKLGGTAGSFGYTAESKLLKELELILESFLNSKPSNDAISHIDKLINDLAIPPHLQKNQHLQNKGNSL